MKTMQKKKKELWYKIVYLIFTTLLAATILVAQATSKMLVSKFVRPVAWMMKGKFQFNEINP